MRKFLFVRVSHIEIFCRMFSKSPQRCGVVVAATDVLLLLPNVSSVKFANSGVSGVGIRSPARLGTKHGVFCFDSDGKVTDFVQKGSRDVLEQRRAIRTSDDTVLLDSGIIWFAPDIAAKYIELIKKSPALLSTRFELYSGL